MKVLVIGGAGFIGSHIVDMLVDESANVTVLDRQLERFRGPLARVSYVQGDIGNKGQLEELMSNGVDAVIHLAWTTIPKTSNEDPAFDVQTNVLDSINLFDLCASHRVKRIVFASSGGAIYGKTQTPVVTEECETLPISSYGITKLAVEKYLAMYSHVRGLSGVSLRLANPYGSRQNPLGAQGAVAVFMSKVLDGEPIEVWGDGSVVRDFIHIKDVSRLFRLSLLSDVTGVFNAGSGVGLSVNELISAIGAECGRNPAVIYKQGRVFDVPRIILESGKARRAFGWQAGISMKDGLGELRDWLHDWKQRD